MISIFLKSLAIGFLILLPLGPIGILCLRRILQLGPLQGFILGLGQVLAVFLLNIIIVFGLGVISDYMIQYQSWILGIGGAVLIVFGVKIFFSKSFKTINKIPSQKKFIIDFFSIAFFTLINPGTLLAFIVLSAILDLYTTTRLLERITMIFGILTGSLISWALVCLCFIKYKKNITQNAMTWINRFIGVCLALFGIAVCTILFF